MSLRGRDRAGQDIDLKAVISFLQMLWCMTAGIAVLAALGMALSARAGQTLVVYQMTLAVDAVMLIGGGLALWGLRRKDQKIDAMNKEQEYG